MKDFCQLDQGNPQTNDLQLSTDTKTLFQWFVMRDLKRSNAKCPAYKLLDELNIRFFTPMCGKPLFVVASGFLSWFLSCKICCSFTIHARLSTLLWSRYPLFNIALSEVG